jgi:putative salt-induced outer membrane protein YdiY
MGEQDNTFQKSQVLSITVGSPKEINYWDFSLSLGANYRTGNTDQTEMTSKALARRRTVKNRIIFDWFATYNVTDDVTASDNQRLSGTWDLFISKHFFITPVFAEWYRDPFQNIARRYTLAVAAGYDIMDTSKIDWQISGGPGYTRTEFDDVAQGDPVDDGAAAFIFGTTYDHEISRKIDFLFDYRATITNDTSGKYLHHLLTSLEFELTNVLDFDITWVWDRIQEPRANSDETVPEQDDFRLSFMLGLDF